MAYNIGHYLVSRYMDIVQIQFDELLCLTTVCTNLFVTQHSMCAHLHGGVDVYNILRKVNCGYFTNSNIYFLVDIITIK